METTIKGSNLNIIPVTDDEYEQAAKEAARVEAEAALMGSTENPYSYNFGVNQPNRKQRRAMKARARGKA